MLEHLRRWSAILATIFVFSGGCSSVDIVRLQPDLIEAPEGMEPLAGIQASCLGFYLFTLGLPYADMDKAVNELLLREAKKLGATSLVGLRFEGTPSGGIWWLSKLFWFRSARAYGIAVVPEPGAGEQTAPGPPPLELPPPPTEEPAQDRREEQPAPAAPPEQRE